MYLYIAKETTHMCVCECVSGSVTFEANAIVTDVTKVGVGGRFLLSFVYPIFYMYMNWFRASTIH